jgi:hypothetical protein
MKSLTSQECIARIAKGGCVLCQEAHPHYKCDLRKNMGETSMVKRFIKAYADIRHEQKNGEAGGGNTPK